MVEIGQLQQEFSVTLRRGLRCAAVAVVAAAQQHDRANAGA